LEKIAEFGTFPPPTPDDDPDYLKRFIEILRVLRTIVRAAKG